MKKIVCATILAFICSIALAGDWLDLGDTDTHEFRIKPSSMKEGFNTNGEGITSAEFEDLNKVTRKVSISKKYVRHVDCAAGRGHLVATSLDDEYIYKTDFSIGGKSVGSSMASILCFSHQTKVDEIERQKTRSEAYEKWRTMIDEFIAAEAKMPGGIDYNLDPIKMAAFDKEVRRLGGEPKNEYKPMLWFLTEANKNVRKMFGLKYQ